MKTIRKHTQNVWIDSISFICMIILIVTGVLLKFKIPPGSHGSELWGWSRHQWGDFHFWVAIVMTAGITVHLLLHIPWIQGVIYPKNSENRIQRVVLFSAGFGLIVIFSLVLLMAPVIEK